MAGMCRSLRSQRLRLSTQEASIKLEASIKKYQWYSSDNTEIPYFMCDADKMYFVK